MSATDYQFRVFTSEGTGTQHSAEAIVSEVLRLHPPTRHITHSTDGRGGSGDFLHRSHLYGSDP